MIEASKNIKKDPYNYNLLKTKLTPHDLSEFIHLFETNNILSSCFLKLILVFQARHEVKFDFNFSKIKKNSVITFEMKFMWCMFYTKTFVQ